MNGYRGPETKGKHQMDGNKSTMTKRGSKWRIENKKESKGQPWRDD